MGLSSAHTHGPRTNITTEGYQIFVQKRTSVWTDGAAKGLRLAQLLGSRKDSPPSQHTSRVMSDSLSQGLDQLKTGTVLANAPTIGDKV